MHSTTLTLDNDIAARLKRLSLMRNESFKHTMDNVAEIIAATEGLSLPRKSKLDIPAKQ